MLARATLLLIFGSRAFCAVETLLGGGDSPEKTEAIQGPIRRRTDTKLRIHARNRQNATQTSSRLSPPPLWE